MSNLLVVRKGKVGSKSAKKRKVIQLTRRRRGIEKEKRRRSKARGLDNRKKKTTFHHNQETVTVNPYAYITFVGCGHIACRVGSKSTKKQNQSASQDVDVEVKQKKEKRRRFKPTGMDNRKKTTTFRYNQETVTVNPAILTAKIIQLTRCRRGSKK